MMAPLKWIKHWQTELLLGALIPLVLAAFIPLPPPATQLVELAGQVSGLQDTGVSLRFVVGGVPLESTSMMPGQGALRDALAEGQIVTVTACKHGNFGDSYQVLQVNVQNQPLLNPTSRIVYLWFRFFFLGGLVVSAGGLVVYFDLKYGTSYAEARKRMGRPQT